MIPHDTSSPPPSSPSSSLGRTSGNHPTTTKSTENLPSALVLTSTPSPLSTCACLAAPPGSSLPRGYQHPRASRRQQQHPRTHRLGTVPSAAITRCHGTLPEWYVFSAAVDAGGRCLSAWPTCLKRKPRVSSPGRGESSLGAWVSTGDIGLWKISSRLHNGATLL